MLKFAQLWRTTTARLTAIFIVLFVVFSILLLGFVPGIALDAINRRLRPR